MGPPPSKIETGEEERKEAVESKKEEEHGETEEAEIPSEGEAEEEDDSCDDEWITAENMQE